MRDPSGAVIAGATIALESGAFQAIAKTGHDGQFFFSDVAATSGKVAVTADGFNPAQESWNRETTPTGVTAIRLEIVLRPSAASEQVTVSAARTEVRLSETPGSTVLLSTADIAATSALRVDDMLRQVPGFSLFRRSGSRTANASSQGVSLRGLGGTAASRALVLEDGFSLVDAFGGWVYWDRIPRAALSTVEVFRGGAANLYGSDALGGVVQFTTRPPEVPAFSLEMSYGGERTPDLSFWAGTRAGKWDLAFATEMFRTDGFVLVPTSQRGSVDTPANSENATVDVNIGHRLGDQGRVFVRGSFFTEFRHNGTPIQTNDTHLAEVSLGLVEQFGANDSLSFRAHQLVQAYNQRFSSVSLPDRDGESLTNIQHIPEQVGGADLQWTHLLGRHQTLLAGLDLMEVMGASDERLFSGPNRNRNGGGRQRIFGLFGEDIVRLKNWTIILAVRMDRWNNFDANLVTAPNSSSPAVTFYPDRTDLVANPRLSVLRSLNRHLSLTGSVYRAFRAPTLNELYRTFRVGNIVTMNNPALTAERLTGAEVGLNVTALERKLELRGTFFWSDIVDPVENVTLDPNSSPIKRQKANLGRTRSRGVELDGVLHVKRDVQISAGYEFTGATVVSYPVASPAVSLVGLDVPQVPRNVFTWEARYWNPSRLLLSVQGRFVGRQFDDDQNQYRLDRFYTMDFQIGRALTRQLEIFAAAENVLGQRYQVARTPVINLGPPILYRFGLRLNYPAESK
ncbi:MAG: TonB-dependent receptor [Acidobacteriia bacterium]|nr:TonB-dependent receptor [Terriglobia bacterium]